MTSGERITHGRHCACSACARQDWTDPRLAPCGMHGPTCPAVNQTQWESYVSYLTTFFVARRAAGLVATYSTTKGAEWTEETFGTAR